MADAILHAFDWPFDELEQEAAAIAEAGFGAVLTAPPLSSDPAGSAWWQRYQPRDYRVIRSHLGGKPELVAAIDALHAAGLRVYTDVVFNHMANEARRDRFYFPGQAILAEYADTSHNYQRDRLYGDLSVGLFSPWDFNRQGDIDPHEWLEPSAVQEQRLGGLPDLDLNDWVVEQQRRCLAALRELGIDGYRIDAIKHLPEEHVRRVFLQQEAAGSFRFCEVLTTGPHEERLYLAPILDRTDLPCYDFPLFTTLRRAFAPGGSLRELVDPAAYGNALPWWRAVTFAVNHDLPYNHGFRGLLLDPQDEYLAWAYLLGRDGGVPLLFSDHGESAADHPQDAGRWHHAWRRYDLVQMLRFHNAVHGEAQHVLFEGDEVLLLRRGERGILALNKSAEWRAVPFWTWGLRHGRYRDQLHQHELELQGEVFTLHLPPRQAQLWLAQES